MGKVLCQHPCAHTPSWDPRAALSAPRGSCSSCSCGAVCLLQGLGGQADRFGFFFLKSYGNKWLLSVAQVMAEEPSGSSSPPCARGGRGAGSDKQVAA